MSDIRKCKQCGKHVSKYRLHSGICVDCKQSNYNYWDQFTTEEGDSS